MNKNEKMALVPNLRFPEFGSTGEWQVYKLDDIADRLTEKVGDRQFTTLSISAGVGFVSQAEKFSRDISGKQYENYIFLKKGDFSYNKGNSKKFPQGCIYELKEYDEAAVPNAFISFHFNENYVSSFYKGYFENNFHGKQLKKFITSGARSDGLLNINPSDFFSIILPTPREKEEQQKIADCLSSLDDLIAEEDKKLEALRAHKKGLMQKLFPTEGKTVPEWRFPEFSDSDEWGEKKLGQLLTIGNGRDYKHLSNGNIPVYGSGGYMLSVNDFLYDGESVCIGRKGTINNPIFLEGKFWTVDTLFYTHSFINCIPRFMYNIFQNIDWIKYNEASGVPSLSKTTIEKIKVFVPRDIAEQKKIADCLSCVDDLITEQVKKIEALKTHKIGLMQGLFPSIEEVGE